MKEKNPENAEQSGSFPAPKVTHIPGARPEAPKTDVRKKVFSVDSLSQSQSVQRAIEEEAVAQNYVVRRYQTLVDRKYVQGLSTQETEEFEALKTTLDALEQPFYERLIARVRMLVEEEGANA